VKVRRETLGTMVLRELDYQTCHVTSERKLAPNAIRIPTLVSIPSIANGGGGDRSSVNWAGDVYLRCGAAMHIGLFHW